MKDRESQFALYLQLIKSMQKVSEAKNMKFIAGYINSKDDFFDGTEYSDERLISMLEEQDINVVDLSLEKGGELSPSYYLHEEGNEMLESKRINIFLDSFGRKPANSTSIVDKLGAKGAVTIEADGLHAHKKFRLTGAGQEEAMEIVGRLRRGTGGKFAVVG